MSQVSKNLPQKQSKADYVRVGFDRIAARYDFMNDLMTFGLHRRWKREVVRRLDVQAGGRILDICAGTGDLSFAAASEVNNGLVTALDFSPEMIAIGVQRSRKAHQHNIVWMKGDAMHLPFKDNSFDGATVGFGLRNVISIEDTLKEVHRVLKTGGMFINLDTASSEWNVIQPFYRLYMNKIVPYLGKLFTGSQDMYAYLSTSAGAFHTPEELCSLFEQCGFVHAGFTYRPRILGGTAIVWGEKPNNS